jgi:hypothetical protein
MIEIMVKPLLGLALQTLGALLTRDQAFEKSGSCGTIEPAAGLFESVDERSGWLPMAVLDDTLMDWDIHHAHQVTGLGGPAGCFLDLLVYR